MMKTIVYICCASALMVGCTCDPVIRTEIVTVNKPVPFIPPPPAVPTCEFMVDKLTAADAKLPGKVGQAYVHDMACLRARNNIDNVILDQYALGSVKFDEAKKRIDELYNQLGTRAGFPNKATVDSK